MPYAFTAATLHALAVLVQAQGKYAEAEPLYQRALRISEQALGPDHPDTTATRNKYASLLRTMEREAEAKKLEEKPDHFPVKASIEK